MKKLVVIMALALGGEAFAEPPSMAPLDDKIKLAPMIVPQESKPDRRPVYVGIGLVLAGLGLWWNRKNKRDGGNDE